MIKTRIDELLREKGINQKTLAYESGIAELSISRIMTGKTKPSFESLEKIAKALNVNFIDLFEKPTQNELTAFVDYNNKVYKAYTVDDLVRLVNELKSAETKD